MATTTEVAVEQAHQSHKTTQFFYVWGALLVLTAVEVVLAYERLQPKTMLSILLVLSVVKAALIIQYFMHMKFETKTMRRVLMVSLVIVLCLMSIFFPDAIRIVHLGVNR